MMGRWTSESMEGRVNGTTTVRLIDDWQQEIDCLAAVDCLIDDRMIID